MAGDETTQSTENEVARSMWSVFEPVHAVAYFAPGVRAAFEEAGVRGFWRGYFAGRAAPLGRVPARQVAAAFYGFRYDMVARAIPSVWDLIEPDDAWTVRRRACGGDLRVAAERADLTVGDVERAAAFLSDVAERCDGAGRPLFSAHLDLDEPDDPFERLWQATTLLREHRGDGHVAALVAFGVEPLQSLLIADRLGTVPVGHAVANRGWTDDDVAAATERLAGRGLVTAVGQPTDASISLRRRVEEHTDEAAAGVWSTVPPDDRRRTWHVLDTMARAIGDLGWLTYPNPVGVPPPTPS